MDGSVAVASVCVNRNSITKLLGVLTVCMALYHTGHAMDDGIPIRQFGVGEVKSVEYSPDGEKLLVGGLNAVLIDEGSGEHLKSLVGHLGQVTSAVYSSDGKMIITCAGDYYVRLWDADTGRLLRVIGFIPNSRVESVAFSSDNTKFAMGDSRGGVKVWDIETGNELYCFDDSPYEINSLCFSPDDKYLVAGGQTVFVWDLEAGEFDREIWPETIGISCVLFSPDGSVLFTGGNNYSGRLWDFKSDEMLDELNTSCDITSASFSPDGSAIVIGGTRSLGAELWNVESGSRELTFSDSYADIYSVDFSPDGSKVVIGNDDGDIVVWSVESSNELNRFESHYREVNAVSFSSDDMMILTSGHDRMARLWDAETGTVIRRFTGHTESINDSVLSGDGGFVLTGSCDDTAKLWDSETGLEIRTFTGHLDDIVSVSFSADDSKVYTASADSTVKEWDAETAMCLRTFEGHEDAITEMVLSDDGKMMATGSEDATAKMWSVGTGDVLLTVNPGSGPVFSVDISPDGKTILTGSELVPVKAWDVETGEYLRSYYGVQAYDGSIKYTPDGLQVYAMYGSLYYIYDAETAERFSFRIDYYPINSAMNWSSDGSSIVFGSRYGGATMWNLPVIYPGEPDEVPQYRRLGNGYKYDAAFSPDGDRLLVGGVDAQVIEIATDDLISQVEIQTEWTKKVCFLPDGDQYLAVRGSDFQLFDTDTGLAGREFSQHSRTISDLDISSDGSKIVSGSYDESAIIWDQMTGEVLYTLMGHEYSIYSVDISSDGSMALTADFEGFVKMWDLSNGEKLREFYVIEGDFGSLREAEFSPDGSQFMTVLNDDGETGRYHVKIWDVETGQLVQTLGSDEYINCATYSHDGLQLLTGGAGNKAFLWDVATGTVVLTFEGWLGYLKTVEFSSDDENILGVSHLDVRVLHLATGDEIYRLQSDSSGVWAVAVSPDEQLILSGESDRSAKIMDMQTGELLHTLVGHDHVVSSVCFSPDGQYALTASGNPDYVSASDGLVKLWSVDNGELVRTYDAQTSHTIAICFSPDSEKILSASEGGTAILWDRETGNELQRLVVSSSILSVDYSSDGHFVALGCDDSTVSLWNVIEGVRERTIHTGGDRVQGVSFSPDGEILATALHQAIFSSSSELGVKLFNVGNGDLINGFGPGHCFGVSFLPNGKHVAVSYWSDACKVFDIESGEIVNVYPSETREAITVTPNSGKVVSGTYTGVIYIWDLLPLTSSSGMKFY